MDQLKRITLYLSRNELSYMNSKGRGGFIYNYKYKE